MSIQEMTRVWDKSPQKETSLLILLAIANYANDVGHCWPGRKVLQKHGRCDIATVTRVIAQLEADHEVYVHRQKGEGNQYVVLSGLPDSEKLSRINHLHKKLGVVAIDHYPPRMPVVPNPETGGRIEFVPKSKSTSRTPLGTNSNHDPLYDPSIDPSITPAPNGAALDSPSIPRERTELELAIITEIFNLPADTPFDKRQSRKRRGLGFQVGEIHNFIKREYPTHTAVEVKRFKVYYQNAPESKGAAMVTDITKFEGHYRRFAVALAKKNAAQSLRNDAPPPPRPTYLTDEERTAAIERIEKAKNERLQQQRK